MSSRKNLQLYGIVARLGITQEQAAAIVGVTPQHFRKWLQGLHRPQPAALRLLERMTPAEAQSELNRRSP